MDDPIGRITKEFMDSSERLVRELEEIAGADIESRFDYLINLVVRLHTIAGVAIGRLELQTPTDPSD